ncbi:hypothetical protein M153_15440002159 [Pseudoloma neurophilia]|uniref:Transposable element n=1 Tax=Pseudoloma neurophilia TaxID=146866 RepID=A0A0R0LUP5_9MICR|nr:hypothetical protein M153_15440002159 [Pseudoloma neurophilia]
MGAKDNNKSSLNNKMASAVKVFPTFAGMIDQDVSMWLRDCKIIAKTLNMDDETTRKILILVLKDKAL